MNKKRVKRYKQNRQNALEQIIGEQQNTIDSLRRKNDMLQADIDYWKNDRENLYFFLDTESKECNQSALTAKYLVHIFMLMDALEKILERNTTLGRIIKKAFFDFRANLSEGMLMLHYDGKNVWFDPEINENEVL
jgi:uncharacterized coiled-coil DUF342 family protein